MKTKEQAIHLTTATDAPHRKAAFIQPKLEINQPGDACEQQADAVADKIVGAGPQLAQQPFFKPLQPSINRKCACEEEGVQKKEAHGETIGVTPQTQQYIHSLDGKGKPMSPAEKSFFEPKLGYDLSSVRLHTDNEASQSAQQINALAYTHGNNIVFRQGQHDTETNSGKRLMAHELTHVMQQQGSTGMQPVQRYIPPGGNTAPNPLAPPPLTSEANEHKSETVSNATDPKWNNTFTWDAKFQLVYDSNAKRATVTTRLYCDVDDPVKQGWKSAIESRWGKGQFQLEVWNTCKPTIIPIDVDIQWVNQPILAHYVITPVRPGDPPKPGQTLGVGGTANMTTWGTANSTDVPHEYGHMLGNPEEYFTTNGVDYTYGGKKSGYRDRGGGIMNNPSEGPAVKHYGMVRDVFIKLAKVQPAITRVTQASVANPPLKTC